MKTCYIATLNIRNRQRNICVFSLACFEDSKEFKTWLVYSWSWIGNKKCNKKAYPDSVEKQLYCT